jgi:esterase/lipase
MRILNLHGFMGKADNRTYSALCELMPKEDIVSPKLEYMNAHPDEIFTKLTEIIKNEDIDIIIGQSLGGFFALSLAFNCGLPCILTNPCFFPAETKVIVNSEISKDILDEYKEKSRIRFFRKAYILISDNDTIIPGNYEKCKVITPHIKQVEGTHSNIKNLKEELIEILGILKDPDERAIHLTDLFDKIDKIVIVDDARTFDVSQLKDIDFEKDEDE